MDFNCAECRKRLRIPDGRRNPRVRCPNCGLVSRPFARQAVEAKQTLESGSTPYPAHQQQPAPQPRPQTTSRPVQTPPTPKKTKNTGGGLGIVIIISLMLLSRAPGLLRRLAPDKREPPPVNKPDEMKRAVDEILQKAKAAQREREEREKNRQ
jgi:hypothetical protein